MTGADYALATTGEAGPDPSGEGRAVGTLFVALADGSGAEPTVEEHFFPTDRASFKQRARRPRWICSGAKPAEQTLFLHRHHRPDLDAFVDQRRDFGRQPHAPRGSPRILAECRCASPRRCSSGA